MKRNSKKMYHKLFSKTESLNDIVKELDQKDQKYAHNRKYTHIDYICCIIEVLSNNISWRKYNGKINGRTLNNQHNYYVKIGVYEKLFEIVKEKYYIWELHFNICKAYVEIVTQMLLWVHIYMLCM